MNSALRTTSINRWVWQWNQEPINQTAEKSVKRTNRALKRVNRGRWSVRWCLSRKDLKKLSLQAYIFQLVAVKLPGVVVVVVAFKFLKNQTKSQKAFFKKNYELTRSRRCYIHIEIFIKSHIYDQNSLVGVVVAKNRNIFKKSLF